MKQKPRFNKIPLIISSILKTKPFNIILIFETIRLTKRPKLYRLSLARSNKALKTKNPLERSKNKKKEVAERKAREKR